MLCSKQETFKAYLYEIEGKRGERETAENPSTPEPSRQSS